MFIVTHYRRGLIVGDHRSSSLEVAFDYLYGLWNWFLGPDDRVTLRRVP